MNSKSLTLLNYNQSCFCRGEIDLSYVQSSQRTFKEKEKFNVQSCKKRKKLLFHQVTNVLKYLLCTYLNTCVSIRMYRVYIIITLAFLIRTFFAFALYRITLCNCLLFFFFIFFFSTGFWTDWQNLFSTICPIATLSACDHDRS